MKLLLFAALFISLFSLQSYAQKRPQGGDFTLAILSEPSTLNPINSSDAYASNIQSYVMEGLLSRDEDTYELKAELAEKWDISKDKKVFTFTLRENLKWSDGKPLTTKDVKFTFDAIKNPKFKALAQLPYFEGIEKCEIIDDRTVKFIAKTDYFQNFDIVATMPVAPEHIYKDPNARVNRTLTGSGPYMLDKYERGRRIILKKNPLWWGIE